MQNNLFAASGYRLDFFQFYNWGVFDRAVYTLECSGESTLLTGSNGSGKTTVVDGLLSLLVPNRQRFYNQSSGTEQKKERSEASYVLGAYGTIKDEERNAAVQENLRTKHAYSLLSGCFSNSSSNQKVTLLQLRYFAADGTLKQVYSITKQAFLIEEMNELMKDNDIRFSDVKQWRKFMTEQFGTTFYGDNFKQYSNAFISLFGFKSDKALSLFSQIVGVKVLGNLTGFIRTNMLEEQDMEDEFLKLLKNFDDLMTSYNEIEKTEEQLKMLEPVLKAGAKWEKENDHKRRLENHRNILPSWYAQTAIRLLKNESQKITQHIASAESGIAQVQMKLDSLHSNIDSLKISISQNESARRLEDLSRTIEELNRRLESVKDKRAKFAGLSSGFELKVPVTEKSFLAVREKFPKLQTELDGRKKRADSQSFIIRNTILEKEKTAQDVKAELASLGTRSSNIPLANILLRKKITDALRCSEDDLPFAGELIQVKSSESQWEYAIEKLLHNFALCILVPESLYDKVNLFVNKTDLKGRVVYLKTDENAQYFVETETPLTASALSGTVPEKLEIKTDHPLAAWLKSRIEERFDYLCTNDMKDFAHSKRALTRNGLIKSNIRHEKDDRKTGNGRGSRVLGWNNIKKRQELSGELEEYGRQLDALSAKEAKFQEELNGIEKLLLNLNRLNDFDSWTDLDQDSCVKELHDVEQEKQKLLSDAKDLKQLQTQLETLSLQEKSEQLNLSSLQRELGGLQSKLKDTEDRLENHSETLKKLKSQFGEEFITEKCADFEKSYIGGALLFNSLLDLEKKRSDLANELNTKIIKSENSINYYNKNMTQPMNAIVNPSPAVRAKYPNWMSGLQNLGSDGAYLDDFRNLHRRLEKEDLPHYRKEFRSYLNDRLSENITDFYTNLTNSQTDIQAAIANLNQSLKIIPYSQNPATHIQLYAQPVSDVRIREFTALIRNALPDSGRAAHNDEASENEAFRKIKALIDYLKENDQRRKIVLDVRNWFHFAAAELYASDNTQKQYYADSASLSGGEKAKLTYTILASAIAYQFGLSSDANQDKSFRFVIIDEAFSKSDPENSRYAMELFKQLDLQLMVVTPMDKINIAEEYINSVHLAENKGSTDSRLLHMSITHFKELQKQHDEKERIVPDD